MEKFELEKPLADSIRSAVCNNAGFIKLVQTARRTGRVFRDSLRPVMIGGEKMFQLETCENGKVSVKNLTPSEMPQSLENIISQKGARELHVISEDGDMHVRVTKKGHVLVSHGKAQGRNAEIQNHDRPKNQPLASFDSSALLMATGIAGANGEIRASMRGKYDQVNEFLRAIDTLIDPKPSSEGIGIADCGCGKAYLTLAVREWLVKSKGAKNVKVCGIDRREDVIASATRMAKDIDASDDMTFICSDLAKAELPFKPDLTMSLHACDTATDEAIALGIERGSKYIACAPCCQHELQKTIARNKTEFDGLMRHSILRERTADILTDAFRAMLLRIAGYRVQVVKFVSSEATKRNILIKAVNAVKPGQRQAVEEYLALRNYFKVTPWLETRLADRLGGYLEI